MHITEAYLPGQLYMSPTPGLPTIPKEYLIQYPRNSLTNRDKFMYVSNTFMYPGFQIVNITTLDIRSWESVWRLIVKLAPSECYARILAETMVERLTHV